MRLMLLDMKSHFRTSSVPSLPGLFARNLKDWRMLILNSRSCNRNPDSQFTLRRADSTVLFHRRRRGARNHRRSSSRSNWSRFL